MEIVQTRPTRLSGCELSTGPPVVKHVDTEADLANL